MGGVFMRLKVENGYYKFYPTCAHELELLTAKGFSVVAHKDFFTFELLKSLPFYSIEGLNYGGIKAKKTYSDTVEQVLLENKFAYNLSSKAPIITLTDISKVTINIDYYFSDNVYFEELPQIGGFMNEPNSTKNRRLRGFSGYWKLMGSGIILAESLEYYAN
jgi:hypothetical protein